MLSAPLFTKINHPQPRQILSRPRLLDCLGRCRDYRLLLISAATGFGKTSLLTDFARSSEMALAWYSLDESDRDPAVFCRYLLYSFREIYPSFGQSFEELLEQNLKELHQESIIFRLAEEFVANLELLRRNPLENFRETLLVLDDFQFAESFGVNRFVQRLVWWLPEKIHLIISSRVMPEDLLITRLTAKQMMTALGPRDLAFTTEEVNQLLSEFYATDNLELAETLTAYSEGWITAVILALSNQNQDLIRSEGWRNLKASTNSFDADQLFNYLAQEVFENQTPELQKFLLKTSVLDLLNPLICDALLEGQVSEQAEFNSSENILKQLETRNLFITRLSSNGQLYFQYHTLFRQFLRSKLKVNKQLYQQIQVKAAEVQQGNGNHTQAVQHYVAAGEINQAANLLNEIIEPLYEAGRIRTLADLLDSIPAQEQANLPHLLSAKARLLLEHGDNEAALKTYAEAERTYRQESATDWAALAMANQAQLLVRTGQRRNAISLCTQILRDYNILMQTLEGQKAVALAKFVLGMVSIEEGKDTEAEKNLRDAAEIYKACNDNFRVATVDSYFGLLYHRNGRLVKSNIYCERALAYFIKVGNRGREAYCRVSLAINLYIQGQYQEAERQFNETLILTQDLNDQYLRLFVLVYLGNVYRETERYLKAEATYVEALQLAREGHVRKMELLLLNDQATNFILQGKKQEAQNLIRLTIELAEEYDLPERLAASYRNQSWLDFDSRSFKRALTSIEKAISLFNISKARLEEARSKLSLAVIWMGMNEPRKAVAVLTESLELTEELGFEPFLPFELKQATTLFEYAGRKKINEPVEVFLRRRGFISGLPEPINDAVQIESTAAKNTLPEPIQLSVHLENRNASVTRKDNQVLAGIPIVLKAEALNGGRVWLNDKEVEQWRMNKSREALFYLLEHKKCSRDELLEALWADEDFGASPNLLHNTLFHLRKAIAPIEIKLSGGRYYLDSSSPGQIWYDADEFRSELKATLTAKEFDANRLTRALNLYKRDFLDQFYSNWNLEQQQQLLQLYTSSLEKLARFYEKLGQYQIALSVWRQLLIKDPYNEEVHRATIACLLAMGNKPEARRQSNQCLKALSELDLQPSPETKLLLQKLA